jgi:hypothetical protein
MNWENPNLFVRGSAKNTFKIPVDRTIRELRQKERRLAEHRTTKHQFQARNSCVADARSYRVASHRFKRWLTVR